MQDLALDLIAVDLAVPDTRSQDLARLKSADAPALQPAPQGDHYVVEVGGRFVSEYGTLTAALSAGLDLKRGDAQAQVRVYDARERAAG